MALKPDYELIESSINWSCEAVAERGTVLVLHTSGSGVAIGATSGKGTLASSASGTKVLGYLMHDVVSLDETRYHRNFHKNERLTGEKVEIGRKGWVVTNKVTGTPAVGDTAYLTSNGVVTPTVSSTGGTSATPKVGWFASTLDADGYARVEFNLPVI